MERSWGIALTLGLLASTSTAHAQRGLRSRNGPAMTPYGPVTNPTTTPE